MELAAVTLSALVRSNSGALGSQRRGGTRDEEEEEGKGEEEEVGDGRRGGGRLTQKLCASCLSLLTCSHVIG